MQKKKKPITSEAQRRANKKAQTKFMPFTFKLQKERDKELIDYLKEKDNLTAYLKELIINDIEKSN